MSTTPDQDCPPAMKVTKGLVAAYLEHNKNNTAFRMKSELVIPPALKEKITTSDFKESLSLTIDDVFELFKNAIKSYIIYVLYPYTVTSDVLEHNQVCIEEFLRSAALKGICNRFVCSQETIHDVLKHITRHMIRSMYGMPEKNTTIGGVGGERAQQEKRIKLQRKQEKAEAETAALAAASAAEAARKLEESRRPKPWHTDIWKKQSEVNTVESMSATELKELSELYGNIQALATFSGNDSKGVTNTGFELAVQESIQGLNDVCFNEILPTVAAVIANRDCSVLGNAQVQKVVDLDKTIRMMANVRLQRIMAAPKAVIAHDIPFSRLEIYHRILACLVDPPGIAKPLDISFYVYRYYFEVLQLSAGGDRFCFLDTTTLISRETRDYHVNHLYRLFHFDMLPLLQRIISDHSVLTKPLYTMYSIHNEFIVDDILQLAHQLFSKDIKDIDDVSGEETIKKMYDSIYGGNVVDLQSAITGGNLLADSIRKESLRTEFPANLRQLAGLLPLNTCGLSGIDAIRASVKDRMKRTAPGYITGIRLLNGGLIAWTKNEPGRARMDWPASSENGGKNTNTLSSFTYETIDKDNVAIKTEVKPKPENCSAVIIESIHRFLQYADEEYKKVKLLLMRGLYDNIYTNDTDFVNMMQKLYTEENDRLLGIVKFGGFKAASNMDTSALQTQFKDKVFNNAHARVEKDNRTKLSVRESPSAELKYTLTHTGTSRSSMSSVGDFKERLRATFSRCMYGIQDGVLQSYNTVETFKYKDVRDLKRTEPPTGTTVSYGKTGIAFDMEWEKDQHLPKLNGHIDILWRMSFGYDINLYTFGGSGVGKTTMLFDEKSGLVNRMLHHMGNVEIGLHVYEIYRENQDCDQEYRVFTFPEDDYTTVNCTEFMNADVLTTWRDDNDAFTNIYISNFLLALDSFNKAINTERQKKDKTKQYVTIKPTKLNPVSSRSILVYIFRIAVSANPPKWQYVRVIDLPGMEKVDLQKESPCIQRNIETVIALRTARDLVSKRNAEEDVNKLMVFPAEVLLTGEQKRDYAGVNHIFLTVFNNLGGNKEAILCALKSMELMEFDEAETFDEYKDEYLKKKNEFIAKYFESQVSQVLLMEKVAK